ncbi:hypothetical protein HW555_009889 [Spodoptera exigua]|uniref:BEN domain-containing protein n=1 Tax=Spodoptera exigua TaxID=7107 RepID=A0A835GC70_SPOEX|nr:hypothetical protein HW555_009889 [Spodoptera exigua]
MVMGPVEREELEEPIQPMAPVEPMVVREPVVVMEAVEPMGPVVLVEPVEPMEFMAEALAAMVNNNNDRMMPIGSGRTLVPQRKFRKVKWTSYTVATRTLLVAVFPRRVLATHSLSGKKSPAFLNKPPKDCLNEQIVDDVILEVLSRFKVTKSMVRKVITTKCADECKMLRTRAKRRPVNNENIPP